MSAASTQFLIPGVPLGTYTNGMVPTWNNGSFAMNPSQSVATTAIPSFPGVTTNPGATLNINTFVASTINGVATRLRAPNTTNGAGLAWQESDGAFRGVISIASSISSTPRALRFETATGNAGAEVFTERAVLWSDGLSLTNSLQVGAAEWVYFGGKATDGSWRQGRDGNNLVSQRREAGAWVTKQTITP